MIQNYVIFAEKESQKSSYWKVRDHCNYTGKYGSATHSICDLNCNLHNEISVHFYNGSNYDEPVNLRESLNVLEKIQRCTIIFLLQ